LDELKPVKLIAEALVTTPLVLINSVAPLGGSTGVCQDISVPSDVKILFAEPAASLAVAPLALPYRIDPRVRASSWLISAPVALIAVDPSVSPEVAIDWTVPPDCLCRFHTKIDLRMLLMVPTCQKNLTPTRPAHCLSLCVSLGITGSQC
jgi:hypothetical protein